MKKKHLTSLSLHKNTISQLTATRVLGGGPPFAEEGTNGPECQGVTASAACSMTCE